MKKILFSGLVTLTSLAAAQAPDYAVQDGQFVTAGVAIPEGCFGQLMTEPNGDDSVAAVFLGNTTLRGCLEANFPYPGGDEQAVTYRIEAATGDDTYQLHICQALEGSLGALCSQVVVQFVNRTYVSPEGDRSVLSLEKRGEW